MPIRTRGKVFLVNIVVAAAFHFDALHATKCIYNVTIFSILNKSNTFELSVHQRILNNNVLQLQKINSSIAVFKIDNKKCLLSTKSTY